MFGVHQQDGSKKTGSNESLPNSGTSPKLTQRKNASKGAKNESSSARLSVCPPNQQRPSALRMVHSHSQGAISSKENNESKSNDTKNSESKNTDHLSDVNLSGQETVNISGRETIKLSRESIKLAMSPIPQLNTDLVKKDSMASSDTRKLRDSYFEGDSPEKDQFPLDDLDSKFEGRAQISIAIRPPTVTRILSLNDVSNDENLLQAIGKNNSNPSLITFPDLSSASSNQSVQSNMTIGSSVQTRNTYQIDKPKSFFQSPSELAEMDDQLEGRPPAQEPLARNTTKYKGNVTVKGLENILFDTFQSKPEEENVNIMKQKRVGPPKVIIPTTANIVPDDQWTAKIIDDEETKKFSFSTNKALSFGNAPLPQQSLGGAPFTNSTHSSIFQHNNQTQISTEAIDDMDKRLSTIARQLTSPNLPTTLMTSPTLFSPITGTLNISGYGMISFVVGYLYLGDLLPCFLAGVEIYFDNSITPSDARILQRHIIAYDG